MYSFISRDFENFSEERVEVNQRDLIDKILARYSAEFVIYRELMQNSDDAESQSIQIIFETENNNDDVGDKVIRIIFKNDGHVFSDDDWNRLKKIAEGNPDEQKIGAFGVGFYSLFSVCDDPVVLSGGQGMKFYWRGNQLFTKKGEIEQPDDWTTFIFVMKEPIDLLNVEEFAQFLANSLGFTENLREISVFFNNISMLVPVIKLSKAFKEPRSINIASNFNTFSPQQMVNLTSVDVKNVQLDVELNVSTETNASIHFRIATGNLNVNVDDKFSKEMEKIIKKRPPKKTTIQVIFTGFDEYNSRGNISDVFKELFPFPEQGKIYIGFQTHQTTGCCIWADLRNWPKLRIYKIY